MPSIIVERRNRDGEGPSRFSGYSQDVALPPRPRLWPVAISVGGQRELDAMPRVAGRFLGPVPAYARAALAPIPVTPKVRFDLFELAALVLRAGVPAVLVRRTVVVVVRAARLNVGARLVVLAPIRVLVRRVDGLGRALEIGRAHV